MIKEDVNESFEYTVTKYSSDAQLHDSYTASIHYEIILFLFKYLESCQPTRNPLPTSDPYGRWQTKNQLGIQ